MSKNNNRKRHPSMGWYMVVDGEILQITTEDLIEGFRNCDSLTSMSLIDLPNSITSAAFVID